MKKNRHKKPPATLGQHISGHPAESHLCQAPRPDWWTLRFDGNVRDNGKSWATGRWSFALHDATGSIVGKASWPCSSALVTNNVSEWEGCFGGLMRVERLKKEATFIPGLLIEGDSDLVIRQLTGLWKTKTLPLEELRDECLDILGRMGMPWSARWIPREQNEYCDALGR